MKLNELETIINQAFENKKDISENSNKNILSWDKPIIMRTFSKEMYFPGRSN